MNKKLLVTAVIALASTAIHAQVGVNTPDPKSSMDVRGKVDAGGVSLTTDIAGLQAPRLTRAELTNKGNALYGTDQKGAFVYITDISGGDVLSQRVNITTIGYYYFDGALWQSISNGGIRYFYAPSVVLPTANINLPAGVTYDAGTQTFTANLYSIYSNQYGMTGDVAGTGRTAIRSDATISLPVETASNLAYFVTYFDNTVYDPSSITLSTAGVMTYKILASGLVTEKTFMNIVFKIK